MIKIVIDCANGATTILHHVLPIGADIIPIGVKPNGANINNNIGTNHPKLFVIMRLLKMLFGY